MADLESDGASRSDATDSDAALADGPGWDAALSDAALARRLQILATEHWGLLAARGTAQSEVLTRITIYLTLVSAGLVTVGLLGQATRFSGWFATAALGILAFLSLVGLLTLMRVMAVSEEDMMYVLAMNRLRGAYAQLDAEASRYFLASIHDDVAGMRQTYSFLRPRGSAEQMLASSAFLTVLVNAIVVGLLGSGAVVEGGGTLGWAIAVGAALGVVVVAASVVRGGATFLGAWRRYTPLRPTPAGRTGRADAGVSSAAPPAPSAR